MPGKGYVAPNLQVDPKKLKLYSQYGGQEKYLAAKKAYEDSKKKYEGQQTKYEESNRNLLILLNAPTYGLYARLNDAKTSHNATLVSKLNAEISSARSKIADNNRQLYILQDKVVTAQKKFEKTKVTSGSGKDTSNNSGSGTAGKGPWNFNAPLVRSAYFTDLGNLPKPSGPGQIVGDAKTFWSALTVPGLGVVQTLGGKGTIQMDRLTNTVELKAAAKKTADKNKLKFDDKMYGFKFLYNPTTINMTWAGMMGANPVFEAAGLDPAVPMDRSLMTGTISFEILLNRIGDLAMLNPDGTYTGQNPYVTDISLEDRKDIVNKGTMYDLEYLFKSLHGYAFYTNFESTLMGKTNDPGWLPVRPVELHLGNKLRYRVRVSGLDVAHKIFDKKMTPILSVVTVTCGRYWDGPPAKDAKK